jgi:hypothetical protein
MRPSLPNQARKLQQEQTDYRAKAATNKEKYREVFIFVCFVMRFHFADEHGEQHCARSRVAAVAWPAAQWSIE